MLALWLLAGLLLALLTLIGATILYCLALPLHAGRSPLPQLDGQGRDTAVRLHEHIAAVASRPHNIAHFAELEAAARYIEATLRSQGHAPRFQAFACDGRMVRNIEVVVAPEAETPDTPTIVVGAHYDSADDSPGAHDNGTGVAALLELARRLLAHRPSRARLRLVFFVNEEQPYGKTPGMGSWQHAQRLSQCGERVEGMIALETLGYFSSRPGSQAFPWPFALIYPDVGDFIAFVGLPGSRPFLRRTVGAFRANSSFPSIGGLAPASIEGIDLSDHWAYAQFGIPALMVTDTAPFRNPYYHRPHDLPDTVDYASLAHIVAGLELAIKRLAD